MKRIIWKTSSDGAIDFVSLTPDYLEESLDVIRKSFFNFEYVSVAIGLPGNITAIRELDKLLLHAVEDGVSVIGVERKRNKVCGVALNKIQVRISHDNFYKEYFNICRESSAKSMLEFMNGLVVHFDFFEHCKVNCLLEIMFLATLPEYMKKGIGKSLCEVSIELARKLSLGENVKCAINRKELLLDTRPEVITAIFTSTFSQKIGRNLNWEIASTASYDQFTYEGRTFSSILGGEKKYMTFEFERL